MITCGIDVGARTTVEAVRRALGKDVRVPENPQTTGALGAALVAADRRRPCPH